MYDCMSSENNSTTHATIRIDRHDFEVVLRKQAEKNG